MMGLKWVWVWSNKKFLQQIKGEEEGGGNQYWFFGPHLKVLKIVDYPLPLRITQIECTRPENALYIFLTPSLLCSGLKVPYRVFLWNINRLWLTTTPMLMPMIKATWGRVSWWGWMVWWAKKYEVIKRDCPLNYFQYYINFKRIGPCQ